jgi:hypothetical protein
MRRRVCILRASLLSGRGLSAFSGAASGIMRTLAAAVAGGSCSGGFCRETGSAFTGLISGFVEIVVSIMVSLSLSAFPRVSVLEDESVKHKGY